ncbi:MAG: hypothetical protein ACYTG7_16030 [Planctomycetota bacterium]|jgi:hypothetical protein
MKRFYSPLVLLFILTFLPLSMGQQMDPLSVGGTGTKQEVRKFDHLAIQGKNLNNFAHLMDVEVSGDRAYVAVGVMGGLETYDISDPTNPVKLNATGFAAWGSKAYGDRIYVFCRKNGFGIYDISGSVPSSLGTYNPIPEYTLYENGVIDGNTLYVAAHQKGLIEFNVINPGSPTEEDHLLLAENSCWDVEKYGSYLLVANGRFGMSVVEIGATLTEIAVLPLPGLANHIVLDGNVAFLTLGVDGVATVDISTPTAPQLLDIAPSLGCAFGCGNVDHRVAVGSWRTLETFDILDPANIRRAGWDDSKTWAMGADMEPDTDGNLAVIADWRGMAVYKDSKDQVPDIELSTQNVDFGPVTTSEMQTVKVRNTGTLPLVVNVGHIPTGILVDPASFTVDPGFARNVSITATGTGTVRDFIYYYTNDPDEGSKIQYVYKNNTSFPQVESQAPDFTMQDKDGFWHSLSDYVGKVIYLEFGGMW